MLGDDEQTSGAKWREQEIENLHREPLSRRACARLDKNVPKKNKARARTLGLCGGQVFWLGLDSIATFFSGPRMWMPSWWIRRWIGGWPGMKVHLRPLLATDIIEQPLFKQ